MLYLFGRLALSDSLSYHEDLADLTCTPSQARFQRPTQTQPEARAAAISRRLRRSRHFPQSARTAKCRCS